MTNSIKILLLSAMQVATGIFLLVREYPETPIYWWGWVIPFLLPIPVYLLLSKIEVPKRPVSLERHSSEIQFMFWDFRFTVVLAMVYFLLVFCLWIFLKSWLYESAAF